MGARIIYSSIREYYRCLLIGFVTIFPVVVLVQVD